jgi:hypothetical protein
MILGPELLYLCVLDRNVGISDIELLMNWKELKLLGIRLRCQIYYETPKVWSVCIRKFIYSRL